MDKNAVNGAAFAIGVMINLVISSYITWYYINIQTEHSLWIFFKEILVTYLAFLPWFTLKLTTDRYVLDISFGKFSNFISRLLASIVLYIFCL